MVEFNPDEFAKFKKDQSDAFDPADFEKSKKKPDKDKKKSGTATLVSADIPAVMSQINEDAIAGTLGMPVDAAAAALRFAGVPVGDKPFGGSESITGLMRATGMSGPERPKTGAGKVLAGTVGGATEAALSGGGTGTLIKKAGERFAKPALEKAGEMIRGLRGNIAAGAGGGAGKEAAKATGVPDIFGEAAGGFLGGMVEPAAALRPKRVPPPDVQELDKVLDAYERLKLAPSMAEQSRDKSIGGRAAQWLEGNILPQTIGGGGVMEGFRQQRMKDLSEVQQGIAGEYGNVRSREGMGGEIKKDVMDTWRQVKEKEGEIISGLKAKYGDNDVFAGALVNAVNKPIGGAASADVREATLDPLMIEAQKMVRERGLSGRFTFNDLAALKTKYGSAMEPGFQKNTNDAQVSQLYNAVRDDMESFVRMTNPDDFKALKEANRRYAEGEKNFRAHFKKLVGTGDIPVSAEGAYDIVKGAVTEKGRANMELFRQVWDTLSPTTRGNLSATILGRMGMVPTNQPGEMWERWQLGKFLTEYRTLAPDAKDMLFKNKPDMQQALDDLVTVGDNMQKKILKLASSSRSGTGALVLGQFGLGPILTGVAQLGGGMLMAHEAGSGSPLQAVLWGVGGPWAAANFLTDARLVRSVTAAVERLGNGVDGMGRAVLELGALPKVGKKAVIPQQILDQTPKVPVSQ